MSQPFAVQTVVFQESAADPAAVANANQVYSKDVSGVSQLFSRASGGLVSRVAMQIAATFTAGSILFANASGQLNEDNSKLFYDDTNNRIGIGNAAPSFELDVTGTISSTDQRVSTFAQYASSAAAVSAANTGRIRYDSGGQVFQLSLNGAAYVNIPTGAGSGMAIGNTIGNGPNTGSILFVGAAGVLAQNTNVVVDNANTRVGIGNAAPAVALDVTGAITASGVLTGASLSIPATGFAAFANGSAAAVSSANTGRLRYNTTGQVFQVSLNGVAYVDIVSGTGTGMAIGNTVVGATAGSVLYAGAAGVLAQTNASFFWNTTNSALLLGTNTTLAATYRLSVRGSSTSGGTCISVQALDTASYASTDTYNSAGTFRGAFGFGGSAVAATHLQNRMFVLADNAVNTVITNQNTTPDIFFFCTNTGASEVGRLGIYAHVTAPSVPGDHVDVRFNNNSSSVGGFSSINVNGSAGSLAGYFSSNSAGNARCFVGTINTAGGGVAYLRNLHTVVGNIVGSVSADIQFVVSSTDTTGYAGLGFSTTTTVPASAIISSFGVGGTAVGITDFRSTPFWFSTGADFVLGNASGAVIRFGNIAATVFMQMANGSSSAVSAANTGRIRYNTTGQIFQVSLNGAAYVSLATGAGMAMGATIGNSPTTGSILFVGAAGILEQDNANLFWNNTTNRLGIGETSPTTPLDIAISENGNTLIRLLNENTGGYSSLQFNSTNGDVHSHLGYGNSAVALAHLQNRNYWLVSDPGVGDEDIDFANTTGTALRFGNKSGEVFMQFYDGAACTDAAAGTARFRYNAGTDKVQVSKNGAAFADLI